MNHLCSENGKQLRQLGCNIHVGDRREMSEDLDENQGDLGIPWAPLSS